MRAPRILSAALLGLMVGQSVLGLLFPGQYRDPAWIRAAWFGNDWVTLVVAVPLLAASMQLARAGSVRGLLVWLGLLAYGVYNYAFYMLGAALNALLPLYALAVVLSAAALILGLSRIDPGRIAAHFRPHTSARWIGGYLVFVALGLCSVWLGLWAAHVFAGRPTPVEPEAFKLVASLDLTLMVPALASGGILLWRQQTWGYVIAAIAGVQGALYLLVLSVNSAVLISRGLAQAPGELPMWGALAVTTAAATAQLLGSARHQDGFSRKSPSARRS